MAYSAMELVYFTCATRAEAEMRVGELKRQSIPSRIVRTRYSKNFEVRVPKRNDYAGIKWKKTEMKDYIFGEPTADDLKELEEGDG